MIYTYMAFSLDQLIELGKINIEDTHRALDALALDELGEFPDTNGEFIDEEERVKRLCAEWNNIVREAYYHRTSEAWKKFMAAFPEEELERVSPKKKLKYCGQPIKGPLDAAFVVQRLVSFFDCETWENERFFVSEECAKLYMLEMRPFWGLRERARVISTLDLPLHGSEDGFLSN